MLGVWPGRLLEVVISWFYLCIVVFNYISSCHCIRTSLCKIFQESNADIEAFKSASQNSDNLLKCWYLVMRLLTLRSAPLLQRHETAFPKRCETFTDGQHSCSTALFKVVISGKYKNLNKITKIQHISLKFHRILVFVILHSLQCKIEGHAV